MDSATTAAIARQEGFEVCALSVHYGQRHAVELEAARRVAAALGVLRHVVVELNLRAFGGSALTSDIPVPKDTPPEEIEAQLQRARRALTLPPARAGEIIADGIERRAARVLVGRDAKLLALLERLAPVSYWKFLEPLVRRS